MDVTSVRSLLTLAVRFQTLMFLVHGGGPETNDRPATTVVEPKMARTPKVSSASTDCCRNGGLCVLGAFCHCPKTFYGRYCEHELKQLPCGPAPHASWVKAGCNLCFCFDGHMNCHHRAYDGCDDKPLKEEQMDQWDELVILQPGSATTPKFDPDYYDYYDLHGGERSSSSTRLWSGSGYLTVLASLVWGLICVPDWTIPWPVDRQRVS